MQSDHLKSIIAAALELPADQRDAFILAQCGDNPTSLEEVRSLLHAAAKADDANFFSDLTTTQTFSAAITEKPGATIGRYKLLQLIGEGGFGSVFMAEQTAPIVRRVALKIIKLGMDTRSVIARFEAERQALALMDHPNIARVFDAGATDTGRPYFVMELVTGDPITTFADANKLSIKERLELFAQVCLAVQHAHQKGIIHRDLKPSNILVNFHDGTPFAKVIDFGIAKATAQRLTDKTLFTEIRQLIGTPLYMSPEQAAGSLDIDTRTDVYSLGVLLYELLTGSTPFSSKELVATAYDEMRRIIREVEPPKPSLRLTQTATRSTIAATRRTDPNKLDHALRGELDWIVMKALDKDRKRRYDTPTSLATDIKAHLTGNPVTAAPPSWSYTAQKLIRKHKTPVLAALTLVTLLSAGVIGTTTQMIRAKSAEKVAASQRDELTHQANSVIDTLQNLIISTRDIPHDEPQVELFDNNPTPPTYALAYRLNTDGTKTFRIVPIGKNGRTTDDAILALDHPQLPIDPGTALEVLSASVDQTTQELKHQKENAELEAYIANLAAAQAAMQADRWPEARQRLDACPESKRGWEWKFLHNRAEVVIAHLPIDAYSVVFSPDGTHVLAKIDKELICFDINGKRLASIPAKAESLSAIFSPDGKAVIGSPQPNTIQLYSIHGEPISKTMIHNVEVNEAAFSPDGQYLVTSTINALTQLWTNSGDPQAQPIAGGNAQFSPNGKLILTRGSNLRAAGSFADKARIWNLAGEPVSQSFVSDSGILAVGFNRDGTSVLSRINGGNTLQWFDLKGEPVGAPMVHAAWVNDAEISADGNHLISVENIIDEKGFPRASQARIWNSNGQPSGSPIPLDREIFTTVHLSTDGSRIFVSNGNSFQLFDLQGNELDASLHLPGRARAAESGPDDTILTTSGTDRTILQVWSRDGHMIAEHTVDQENGGGIEVSSGGLIITRSWSWGSGSARPTILNPKAFDSLQVYTKNDPKALLADLLSTGTPPSGLRFDKLGHTLLGQNDSLGIAILPLAEETKIFREDKQVAALPRSGLSAAIFLLSPDGSRLCALNDDRSIRFYDTNTWRELIAIPTKAAITSGCFTPDGSRLIINFADDTMEIWDARDYAARQKDRDVRLTAVDPARQYVAKLLATDIPTNKLDESIRNDSSLSSLQKIVTLEQLNSELDRLDKLRKQWYASLNQTGYVVDQEDWIKRSLEDSRQRATILAMFGSMDHQALELSRVAWGELVTPNNTPQKYLEAFEQAKKAAANQDSPLTLQVFGAALYRAGQFDQALKTLLKSDQKWTALGQPSNANTSAFIAMCYFRQTRFDEAKLALAKCRSATQEVLYVKPLVEANELIEPGSATRILAKDRTKSIPSHSSFNIDAWNCAIRTDLSPESYAFACLEAQIAAAGNPEDPYILNTLAAIQYRAQHFQDSISNAEKSNRLTHDKDSGMTAINHFIIAMSYFRLNKLAEAKESLATGLATKATDMDVPLFRDEAAALIDPVSTQPATSQPAAPASAPGN